VTGGDSGDVVDLEWKFLSLPREEVVTGGDSSDQMRSTAFRRNFCLILADRSGQLMVTKAEGPLRVSLHDALQPRLAGTAG
jgi:hypothetical protein